MKNIMILSAGTGAAWNLCNAIRAAKGNEVNLILCDINPPYLVHSSTLADKYIQVPPIKAANYSRTIDEILAREKIDFIIPLIDWDIKAFPCDDDRLNSLNICSAAPDSYTFDMLSDKRKMHDFLASIDVPTPKVFGISALNDETTYFLKPVIGFGSRSTQKITGKDAKEFPDIENYVVQELCGPEEITADVYFDGEKVHCVCRERLEIKSGVCTKARVYYDAQIEACIQRISEKLKLPACCCVQFMKGRDNLWNLTDFNLRMGGGSALTAAVGFSIADAAVASWFGQDARSFINIPTEEKYVVRYYSELVTK